MKKIEKDNLIAIILVILVIVVVLTSFIVKKNKDKTENKISIVTNYNDFYTVDSCLYRFITHINSNDNDSLLLILDDKYKKDNNINDASTLFSSIPENATFASRKMYYQTVNDNITKYYVFGYAFPNSFNSSMQKFLTEKVEMYFIVYLDSKSSTFSIEPYDGNIFIGGELDG